MPNVDADDNVVLVKIEFRAIARIGLRVSIRSHIDAPFNNDHSGYR